MRAREFIREAGPYVSGADFAASHPDKSVMDPYTSPEGFKYNASGKRIGTGTEAGLEQPLVGPDELIGMGVPTLTKIAAKKAPQLANMASTAYKKIEPNVLGLNPARPKADNIVSSLNPASYGQAADPIAGRFPTKPSDITHAQRSITSQAELDDLRKSGYAVAGKDPNTHIGRGIDQYTGNEKWWSPADAQGRFGRNEFPGAQPVADVRVPVNKLPSGRAASTKDMEIFDPNTQQWGPF